MELLICSCQHFVWKIFFTGWEWVLPENMTLVIRMLDPTVNSCFRISNPNAAFFLRDPSFITQLPESHAIRFQCESSLAREHIKVCVLYCTFSVRFVCFYWGRGGYVWDVWEGSHGKFGMFVGMAVPVGSWAESAMKDQGSPLFYDHFTPLLRQHISILHIKALY